MSERANIHSFRVRAFTELEPRKTVLYFNYKSKCIHILSLSLSLSTAPRYPEEVWPAQPEDALCLWPVLEKRAVDRGRQEQEVLLRQGPAHVSTCRTQEVARGPA